MRNRTIHLLFSLMAITWLAATAHGQDIAARDMLSIQFQQLAEKWRLAYNSEDGTLLTPMYAENAEYISAHVDGYVALGRDRVIANFRNGADSGGRIDTLEVLSVNASCDLATLVTKYVGMAGGRKVNGRNLVVCKRVNGEWRIVTHMTVVRD